MHNSSWKNCCGPFKHVGNKLPNALECLAAAISEKYVVRSMNADVSLPVKKHKILIWIIMPYEELKEHAWGKSCEIAVNNKPK